MSLRLRVMAVLAVFVAAVTLPLVAGATNPTITVGTPTAYQVNNVAHDGDLIGVSCSPVVGSDPAGCVGVGTNVGNQHPLLTTGTIDGSMTASYMDNYGDSYRTLLSSVWCASSQHCIAVGWTQNTDGFYVYVLSGSTWTKQSITSSDDTNALRLTSISCTDINHCVAVGYWEKASSSPYGPTPVAVVEVNGSWQIDPIEPSGLVTNGYMNPPNNELNSVSCTTNDLCAVAGYYSTDSTSSSETPFFATISLTSLSATWNLDLPATQLSDFSHIPQYLYPYVACSSSNFCEGTATYASSDFNGSSTGMHSFFTNFTGSWSNPTAINVDMDPTTAGVQDWGLSTYGPSNLVCPVDNLCLGTGGWGNVLVIDHGSASAESAFSTSGAPTAITCIDSANCVVVGSDTAPAGQSGLAESVWNGSSWTEAQVRPVVAAQAGNEFLDAVSCVSDGHCLAVGQSQFPATNYWGSNSTLGVGVEAVSVPFSFTVTPVTTTTPTTTTPTTTTPTTTTPNSTTTTTRSTTTTTPALNVKVIGSLKQKAKHAFSLIFKPTSGRAVTIAKHGAWPAHFSIAYGNTIKCSGVAKGTYRLGVTVSRGSQTKQLVETIKVS